MKVMELMSQVAFYEMFWGENGRFLDQGNACCYS